MLRFPSPAQSAATHPAAGHSAAGSFSPELSTADTVVMTAVGAAGLAKRLRAPRDGTVTPPSLDPSLSVVIPLFNAAANIAGLVEEVFHEFAGEKVEVILVNDGSSDDTEAVARRLAQLYHGRLVYVQLARNYGEHPAVLAGLEMARGRYVAIIDDDGQNPPAEIRRLRDIAVARRRDVVYGRYLHRRHSPIRRAVSGLHNLVASWLFDKPRGLYLSSFKVLSRFAVDEICRSAGPSPHLDGLILQLTRNFEQLDVLHRPRRHGRSGYTPVKLARLWLDFVVGNSSRLFRPAMILGALLAFCALLGLPAAWLAGVPARTALFAGGGAAGLGILVFYVGLLGECLGRATAACAHRPPFVVRYLYRGGDEHE